MTIQSWYFREVFSLAVWEVTRNWSQAVLEYLTHLLTTSFSNNREIIFSHQHTLQQYWKSGAFHKLLFFFFLGKSPHESRQHRTRGPANSLILLVQKQLQGSLCYLMSVSSCYMHPDLWQMPGKHWKLVTPTKSSTTEEQKQAFLIKSHPIPKTKSRPLIPAYF